MEDKIIHYGEIKCNNINKKEIQCSNNAYYIVDGEYLCGVHSRNKDREELPHFSKREKEEIENKEREIENKEIEEARRSNNKNNRKGDVIVSKLRMMRKPEYREGYLKVFPNNKHQNRKDGFGCSSLSPMKLGPVEHNNPYLPECQTIEGFHQGSKVFREEVRRIKMIIHYKDKKVIRNFIAIKPLFYKNRREFYETKTPPRYKYKGTSGNKNIPLFFIWSDKSGKEVRLTYVDSRQFYCNFYERLASKQKDFMKLQKMIRKGYNIQICGYDGRDINKIDIEKEYLNPNAPFGHELVLYTMLVLDENEYPWRKYKTFEY